MARQFDSVTPLAPPPSSVPFSNAKRWTPRGENVSIIVNITMAGLAVFLICGVLLSIGFKFPLRYSLGWAGIATVVLFLAVVVFVFFDELLWGIEEITGVDHNRDGSVGPKQTTHYQLQTGPGTWKLGEIDVKPELVIAWCQAAFRRQSLSFDTWAPRFALPDGTRGREEYAAFREQLASEGIIKEVGGNVGCKPTRIGWEWIAGFAQMTPADGTPLLDARPQIMAPGTAHTHTHTGVGGSDST